MEENKKKRIAILGSTGSIGTQALEVIAEHPDLYEAYALTANNRVDLLIEQARRFMPDAVVIANESKYPQLKEALADPEGVAALRPEAIAPLVEGLMLSGFAMQAARSSRPASCTDHLFSHLWNMRNHTYNGVTPSHGFQVSVGTLCMCAMFDEAYKSDFTTLDVERCVAAWPSLEEVRAAAERLFANESFAELGVTEITAKYDDKEEVRRQMQLLKSNWPDLKARLQAQCYTYDEMYRYLSIVGAPTKPEDVGITKAQMLADVPFVRHIRRRYNLLDLGLRAGTLDTWVNGVFGKGGIWEVQ